MAGVRKIFTHTSLFLLPILLTSITFISALILSSSPISAAGEDVTYTSTSANASVVVSAACTMTGSGMNSHTAEVPSGTYRADIGTTTIKVTCNDPHGFSIYAIGFSNDEYTGTNHTKLIGTNDNTKTIATGTATSGSTSNWAMKLATNSGATYPITLTNGYGSYSNVPDTYTKVAQRTSQTDIGTGAVGAELTTTYAAFISSTQQPDTYVGKVRYTMVHPYDDEAPGPVYDMQNLSSEDCVTNKATRVMDVRDGEIYKVQRLADGKCWMLENLRLNPATVSLTDLQGKTNASDLSLEYLKNGGGEKIDRYAMNGVVDGEWASDTYYSPKVLSSYKDVVAAIKYGSGSGKIGVYYNFCAASAGNYCFGSGSPGSTAPTGDATEDICPAGWRLPTRGYTSSSDFNVLFNAYNEDAQALFNALSVPFSGMYNNSGVGGGVKHQNEQALYWSSRRASDITMYRISLDENGLSGQGNGGRGVGYTLRCLRKN